MTTRTTTAVKRKYYLNSLTTIRNPMKFNLPSLVFKPVMKLLLKEKKLKKSIINIKLFKKNTKRKPQNPKASKMRRPKTPSQSKVAINQGSTTLEDF